MLVAAGITLLSLNALAQSAVDIAQARELFNEGMNLRDQGDASRALDKLRAANALAHTPITGVELGRTHVTLGHLVEAREVFLSVARLPEQAPETSRAKAARAESAQLADQLRERIPSVVVKIAGAPVNTVSLTIDGASVPRDAVNAPRLVDPGPHIVVARADNGATATSRVELREGESHEVELDLTDARGGGAAVEQGRSPPAPAAPARVREQTLEAPARTRSGSRVAGWVLFGGGAVVGLGGGTLMLVESLSSHTASAQDNAKAYDATKTPWTVGLVGAIVGGVAAAAGVVVLVVTSSGEPHPVALRVTANPGGISIGGTF